MKKRIVSLVLVVLLVLSLCSCSNSNSTFSIRFIDVGQGDAALVECDGYYMLIDGGDESNGNKVYNVLEENGIRHLDILVISHMHEDHIGGLPEALKNISKIDQIFSNTNNAQTKVFKKLKDELDKYGKKGKVRVPKVGQKIKFRSAEIEVIDVASSGENDSLVLMITYGNTRFLFTGDIEDKAQTRISDKYENENDEPFKINLIKMPHHGAKSLCLYRFVRTFMPDNAVISVGQNGYGHPCQETLDSLDNADVKVYRTDRDGDIVIRSDGEELSIECSR